MVSRNGRKQSVRQNGSDRQNRGNGISTRRGLGRNGSSRYPADSAARDTVGVRQEYSVGTLDVLVGLGERDRLGKAFNDMVAADKRVEAVMLPIADGLTLCRKQ